MKCRALAIVACLTGLTPERAAAQWMTPMNMRLDVATDADVPSLGAPRVAGQLLGATLATPVSFVVGGVATRTVARFLGVGDDMASRFAHVGGWSAAALGTAAGPPLAGRQKGVRGSYPAAVGGAVVGGLLSLGIVQLFDDDGESPDFRCNTLCTIAGVAVFVLPSIGATVAWNASRERR